MTLNPQNLYATSASAQPPDVSSTKWLTMDLDHAELGLLEWVLKVEFVIGLHQKMDLSLRSQPKKMATQETKPGTLVFFLQRYIYIYISGLFDIFGTRDLAGLNHKGFEDSKLSLKTAWASNNTWEHTSLCWDSLRLVRLKVETTRDSSTSSTEFPGRDIGKVEDQGWGQRHAELFGDLATQRVFFLRVKTENVI